MNSELIAGELFFYMDAYLYKLPVMALRFFTVYGPRQRPDLAIHKFVARIEVGKTDSNIRRWRNGEGLHVRG